MSRKDRSTNHAVTHVRLAAFVDGNLEGAGALAWAAMLSDQDRGRLRDELALVLSEPELTDEPLDWPEITSILEEWAAVAGWTGSLVVQEDVPNEGFYSVGLSARDARLLERAPPGVQRATRVLLTEFLPHHPTSAERLPRGDLKKLNNRQVWQIDLPDGYRLRYLVNKAARAVHVVYFGPHPSGNPCGREQFARTRAGRQRAGQAGRSGGTGADWT